MTVFATHMFISADVKVNFCFMRLAFPNGIMLLFVF